MLVVCDGPEILVYNGDGTPRWKHFADGVIAGVRVTGAEVVAVDADGRLLRLRAADGRLLDGGDGPPARGLDLAANGTSLVVGAEPTLLPRGGAPQPLPYPGATAAAFGPDAGSVGLGWPDGTFRAVDAATGAAWGEIVLPGPVSGVAWSALGRWVIAAGPAIHVVSGDGKEVVGAISVSAPASAVTVSDDGVLAAAIVGLNQVAVVEMHGFRSGGTVDFRTHLGGLAFGPGGLLAIGLDDGDATRLDVLGGGSIRTEPHPGRGRNTWNYQSHLDLGTIRGAVAYARAGADPIARYVGPEPDRWAWWQIALIAVLVSIVGCTGCTGCGGLLWWAHGAGWI